jgi:hypothetical protein
MTKWLLRPVTRCKKSWPRGPATLVSLVVFLLVCHGTLRGTAVAGILFFLPTYPPSSDKSPFRRSKPLRCLAV